MAVKAVVVGILPAFEVGDPGLGYRIEQQVRRLDVAVDHAPGMSVGQPQSTACRLIRAAALEEQQGAGRRI